VPKGSEELPGTSKSAREQHIIVFNNYQVKRKAKRQNKIKNK
jgi:hypothetical protein